MPRLAPVARADLIRRLKAIGFDGPFPGGRHEFMVRGNLRLILPNPHRSVISPGLLARILRQASVTRKEWEETL